MSDHSEWHSSPIAAFFEAATLLAGDRQPVALSELGERRALAHDMLTRLRARYESLCTDETIAACAPLRGEIDSHYSRAVDATHRIETAWQREISGIEDDCRSMIESVRTLRALLRTAAGSARSTQGNYAAASAAYRDAVARGTRIRSLLGGAESHTEYAQIAFHVALLLQRACDAFGGFMRLHSVPGNFRP